MIGSFYDPELDEGCAFEELISFHGGIGGPQTRPFVLHPSYLEVPKGPILGAAAVHGILVGLAAAAPRRPERPRPGPRRTRGRHNTHGELAELVAASRGGAGWDVLVEPEEVVRVVLRLDRGEPVPGRAGIGRTDARLALVAEEVDVRAGVALL